MIEIKLFKTYDLKGYTLIDAFPGIGLVGPMAGSYMVEKLKMEYIGYIDSDAFPPIAAIHSGTPVFPARLYMDKKFKLIVALSEFVIPSTSVYLLSRELLAFIRKNGISRVISISGMASQKPSETVFVTSPDQGVMKKAAKGGLKPIEAGVVAGVGAVLMINAFQYNVVSMNILVEVNPQIMDPKYAEIAITGLNKIIDIDIDLKDLDEEAKAVESKIRDMLKKMKESPEHYNKAAEATGPSMYA
ncbi:MAG: proteasome assembly chaperone family protein [Candidatus Micrarchaeota archaeon]|nr:proteasome assembly chaperone family protein [Candidatus Micrarchaeota archaeon]MDE1859911.1 proteasome assembly chaperone family protein [Candidatus Micrarchaeota archaeon]